MTPTQRAWVAGLLEGEGCFALAWGKAAYGKSGEQSPYPRVQVRCNMTDEDVIRRLHQTVGGKVRGPITFPHPNHKDQWLWFMGRRNGAERLMREILPYMGERRSAKIHEILDALEQWPERPTARHGTVHMYSAYKCKCGPCRAANAAKGREQRRRRRQRSSMREAS